MFTVFLIVQIMITVALVVVVLLQRSEGGALGIGGGGGGGMGGLMTGRGAANLLTRTTAILAAAFFTTSIVLTIIAENQADSGIEFDPTLVEESTVPAADALSVEDLLGTVEEQTDAGPVIEDGDDEVPAVPSTETVDEGPAIPDEDR